MHTENMSVFNGNQITGKTGFVGFCDVMDVTVHSMYKYGTSFGHNLLGLLTIVQILYLEWSLWKNMGPENL